MPPKEQLSEEINEILDTGIDWSTLKKEDLELLHELVEDGALIEPLAKQIIKEEGKEKLEEVVDDYQVGKYIARYIL